MGTTESSEARKVDVREERGVGLIYKPKGKEGKKRGLSEPGTVATTATGPATTTHTSPSQKAHSVENPIYHCYNNNNNNNNNNHSAWLQGPSGKSYRKTVPLLRPVRDAGTADGAMRKGSSARETAHRRRRLLTAVVSVLNVLLLVLVVAVCPELARVVRASWQRPTTPCRDSTSWSSKGSSSTPPNAVTSSSSGRQAQGRGPEDDAGLTKVLPEDAAFCLPCSAVYLTSLEVRQNLRRFRQRGDEKGDEKGDAMLCCADRHDDLRVLLTTYTEVQYRTALAKGELRVQDIPENKTPLAESHLRLSYDTSSELQDVNDSHILTIQGGEFSNTSVIFHNGKTSVKNAGHYYIYSHVPFNFPSLQSSSSSPPSSPSTPSCYQTLKQEVVKVRNGGEETVLLENSVVPCDLKSKQSCRQHSFVAGIFLLEERDSIFLRVSDPRLVEKGNELQFGLHRI